MNKEYGDGSTREEITYIPSVNISKFVIYLDEPIEDYIKYVEENAKRVNKLVRELTGGKKV